jgi:hypothetical protein
MRFERAELKPYAEPISASELAIGAVYFAVTCVDDDMLIPTVETLVFVGRNLSPDDVEQVYFQDVDSYRDGVRHDSASEDHPASFQSGSEKEMKHIFTYENALDELMPCSLRRSKTA